MADTPITNETERIRLRALVRLRRLERKLDANLDDDAMWARYFEAAGIYLRVERADDGALLTTQELARREGVSVETILDRVKRGQLRPAAKYGKRYRFQPGARPA